MKQPQTFLFNIAWRDALKDYPAEVRLEVYDALIEYAASGMLTELKPLAQMAFSFIKRELDYYREQYQTKVERRRQSAQARWAKGESSNTDEAVPAMVDRPAELPAEEPHPTDNTPSAPAATDPAPEQPKPKRSKAFRAPTLEEVQAYFQEKKFHSSPEEFYDYYCANDWHAGRSKIKDWEATARNWERRQPTFNRIPSPVPRDDISTPPPDYTFNGGFGGKDT